MAGVASPTTAYSIPSVIWVRGLITKFHGDSTCPYEITWDTQPILIVHRKNALEVTDLVANFLHCMKHRLLLGYVCLDLWFIVATWRLQGPNVCVVDRSDKQTMFTVWYGPPVLVWPSYEQIQNFVPDWHMDVEKRGRGESSSSIYRCSNTGPTCNVEFWGCPGCSAAMCNYYVLWRPARRVLLTRSTI